MQPGLIRNRTTDDIPATYMAAVLSERQQLRTLLANARERIDLLELQTSCSFSAAQMQKMESACGVKRVTAEALATGACEYATSSDEELVAEKERDTMQPTTAATTAAAVPATEIQSAAAASPPEDSAPTEATDKTQSKTQKRKALIRQAAKDREEALKQVQRQNESQLLLAFTMSVMAILLIVVGIVYVGTQYVEGYEKSRLFLIGK